MVDTLQAAGALFALAETARIERTQWAEGQERAELAHIANTLEAAGREAIGQSEVYGWAWVKAGATFVDHYRTRRVYGEAPVISHLCRHDTVDADHLACIHCDCWHHRGGRP